MWKKIREESLNKVDNSDSFLSDICFLSTDEEFRLYKVESTNEICEFESSDSEEDSAIDSDGDNDVPIINISTNWSDISGTTLKSFPFTGSFAITIVGEPTLIKCCNAIVDQEAIDLLVMETNRYVEQQFGRGN